MSYYSVQQAEYSIIFRVTAPQEYDLLRHTPQAADLQGGRSELFQGHPQMYYLPRAEGVLLHVFDNRSRVCG